MSLPLRVRAALDKSSRPLDGDFVVTVLAEVAPARRLRHLPLNLGLLLDTSESMQGLKLHSARQAVAALVGKLRPEDRLTLATFATHAACLVRGLHATAEAARAAEEALAGVQAAGVTRLLTGLDCLLLELRRHATADTTSVAVVLSDGYPTTPMGYVEDKPTPYLLRVDREMREHGIALSTIGLGDASNYDQAFLRRLADSGNGRFHYCQSPADVAEDFQREVQQLQRTVLSEVELIGRHLQGRLRRVWRVYPDKKLYELPLVEDGVFRLPVGPLHDEQPQAFLLDIVTGPQPAGRRRLLEVDATWRGGAAEGTLSEPVILDWTDDPRALAQRNEEVIRLSAECLDALLEEQLEAAVASGEVAQQTTVLARKKQLTARLGKTQATRVLEEMEEALAAGQPISQDALARSSQHTKPTQRLG